MPSRARAILWAQFRTLRNRLPRANKLGLLFTAFVGTLWYGTITMIAVAAGVLTANASEIRLLERLLPGGLLLVFLYWVVVPLLLASKGASLELRKLIVYPIPDAEFFRLEMLLRLSAGIEPLIVTAGAFVGLLSNHAVPFWGPPSLIVFVLFTMFLAAGIHELLGRLLMRKGVREIAGFLFVLLIALPQFILTRWNAGQFGRAAFATSWIGWPWTAATEIALGRASPAGISVLIAWTFAAYAFGRRQFERSLRFDGTDSGSRPATAKRGRMEWFFGWPNILFKDPVAALVEKEIRFLTRASRFRMVFVMGFSFGLILWWPMAFGVHHDGFSFMSRNFVTMVSLYAVLLLSDTLFWNVFGFDRSAAQLYFVVPVAPRTVLLAKNVTAAFFVLLETTIALAICVLVRLPVTPQLIAEAYTVTMVATLLLLPIGNLMSLYRPRATDPSKAMRSSRGGRAQVLLLVVYPVIAIPVALAYGARYAFDSEVAFFAVLGMAALFGLLLYHIAMDSAVAMAESKQETIVAALNGGEGPVD